MITITKERLLTINQYAATRLPNPIAVMSGPAILILITQSSCSTA